MMRLLAGVWLASAALAAAAAPPGEAQRGQYIVRLAGCHACHTDSARKGALLAGGLELKTPYGRFHVPNITPDPETGIGRWSNSDFVRAMREGVAPDGRHYYPAFPYTSYTRMTERDLLDLKAYLDTVKPVRHQVPAHVLRFPYRFRFALGWWKKFYFRPGPFQPDPAKNATWNRGAYLVTGPGHCGECHTKRNVLGASVAKLALAGAKAGPDGSSIPNLTPHPKDGLGLWSREDLVKFLKTGDPPYGEPVGPPMDEVIGDSTSHWREDDLRATAEYLFSLPPQPTP
jgi:mono/diheme cytochrome c family protein